MPAENLLEVPQAQRSAQQQMRDPRPEFIGEALVNREQFGRGWRLTGWFDGMPRSFRRPSEADFGIGGFRWLAPPANFHRPSGAAERTAQQQVHNPQPDLIAKALVDREQFGRGWWLTGWFDGMPRWIPASLRG